MRQAMYEIRQQEVVRAKEIEARALKGQSISYEEYLATWVRGELSATWYESCGFLWSRKRLKSDILLKLTGRRRGYTTMTGAR